MKRILFFVVLLLLFSQYFIQGKVYREMVVGARHQTPSHKRPEEKIARIDVDVIEKEGKNRVYVLVADGVLKGKKLILKLSDDFDFEVGPSLRCEVDLNERQFTSAKTEGFDYDKYLFSRGIDGVFKAKNIENIDRVSIYSIRFSIRNFIRTQIREYHLEGLLDALILGDKNEYDLYQRMKELGISHLLVISGLHFSVIHVVVAKCFGIFGNRFIRFVFVVIVMFFLLFIVKESYSAQRAFFTILYSELARLRYRRTDTLTMSSFSLLLILLFQPRASLSTGLYLSYYTYLAVAFLYRRLTKKSEIYLFELFKFSVFIQIATLPISAFLFGGVNLYSFVANSLCVPLMSAMIPLSFFTVFFISVPIVRMSWNFLEELFQKLVAISPVQNISITIPFFEWTVAALCILALGFVFRYFDRRRYRYLYLIAFFLCFFPYKQNEIRIVNFDVLHGDSTLLAWKGRYFLVDTGDGKCRIAGELRRQGINFIDAVIVTHAHKDHLGGLQDLLKNMRVDSVYLTEESLENSLFRERENDIVKEVGCEEDEIEDKNSDLAYSRQVYECMGKRTEVYIVKSSIAIKMEGGLEVEIYRLFDDGDENDNGICAIFKDDEHAYYFFGDASANRIHSILDDQTGNRCLERNTFFLKAPHHGSSTSSDPHLYKRLDPDYVSVSHSHKYQLPSKEFMRDCNCYYSTYYLGTHTITREGLYHAYLD